MRSTVVAVSWARRSYITVSTSAKPKAPTIAGISPTPPLSASIPKVKRTWAWMPSMPTMATMRPRIPAT